MVDQRFIAHAVHCLSIHDELELMLDLLRQQKRPDIAEPERPPPNVIPFVQRCALTAPRREHEMAGRGAASHSAGWSSVQESKYQILVVTGLKRQINCLLARPSTSAP
jgi:hypothetical protein